MRTPWLAAATASLLLLAACGAVPEAVDPGEPMLGLEDVLREQAARYPQMQAQDVYKLLHQATMGPAHLFMGTRSGLEPGLMEEARRLETLPAKHDEPEIEMIHPARNLARVNLRPFLRRGGRIEDLARAVARTTHHFRGDTTELRGSLREAAPMLERVGLTIPPGVLDSVARTMEQDGYPAGIHSREYAAAYAPAYRVVLLQYLSDATYGGRPEDAAGAADDTGE